MGVAASQTVEDGMARRWPLTTLHHEGGVDEYIRIEMVVRRPWSCLDFERRLVIRASRETERVTIALERLRIE